MQSVLIVDDEKLLVKGMKFNFEQDGYTIEAAYDGEEALKLAHDKSIDLIILDLMLPKIDGITVCQKVREFSAVPIIMLTAKAEDMDKIMGLEYGADDYMTKPFQPAELIARVKSQLRRYTSLGGMYQNQAPATTVYQTGELIVDDASKTVTVDGEPVSLTPREYGILCFLTQHAGQVFSISQIYEAVWQEPAYNSENTVAVHIRRIREKIEINPKEPKYLKVVWGIGYKMEKLHPKQLG